MALGVQIVLPLLHVLNVRRFGHALDWLQPDLAGGAGGQVVVVLLAAEVVPQPAGQRSQLHAEGGAHDAVEEEVDGRVHRQEDVGHRAHDEDPQGQSPASPGVVQGDAVEVDDLVDVEKVPGRVEEQEEGDDGEEEDGLPVLFIGVLGRWTCGRCKKDRTRKE